MVIIVIIILLLISYHLYTSYYEWVSHLDEIKYRFGNIDTHNGMLKDLHRMETYRTALEENPSLISGKSVLDVGCGTGILGSFALTGGASRVVGVDLVNLPKVPKSDGVEFIIGKPVQDVSFDEKFDVIVSEWMGQMLYEENSVDMILHARDNFLKPGGAILPDMGNIYVCGFKGKQYGKPGFKTVEYVNPKDIVTNDYLIHNVDFMKVKLRDTFKITSDVRIYGEDEIDGLVVWFDVDFTQRFCKEKSCILNTKRPTSWFHSVLRFENPCKPEDIKNIKLIRSDKLLYKVWVNNKKFNEGLFNMNWEEEAHKLLNPSKWWN